MIKPSLIDINYFHQFVKKTQTCWIWQGTQFDSGYGRFYMHNKSYRAHRFSYLIYKGKINKGKVICHSCDNPLCVNPDHLWQGTSKQNCYDMIKKNRNNRRSKSFNNPNKFHGVFYRKESKKWRARFTFNYKNYYIGQYNTELEAAKAYDIVAKEVNKNIPDHKKLFLNFP